MLNRHGFILGLLFLGLSIGTHAQGQTRFSLTSDEPTVSAILAEITANLPVQMKNEINRPLVVKFTQTDKNDRLYFPTDEKVKTLTNPAVAGEYVPGLMNNSNEIQINKNFLPLLKTPGYKEKNLTATDYFKKTVYHELAHIYDFLKFRNADETTFYKENCGTETYSDNKKAPWCNHYNRVGRFSEDMQFMNLDNWDTSKESKNTQRKNAIDPYVFKNSGEAFAAYFEAFMMDPSFACKKPALYNYYTGITRAQPFNGKCKSLNSRVYTHNQEIDLDPSRLYQIHFFLAAKGEGFASRWGHAMLRLVYCAPYRKKMDDECIKDVKNHVIISFRANIDSLSIDNGKGLTGKYPSQMFVLPFNEVKEEYTEAEFRDVQSLPLVLNQKQKQLMLEKILETYWDYRGKYYFLSNNCASETLSMLFSVIDDTRRFDLIKYNDVLAPTTPVGMGQSLIKFNIAQYPSLPESQLIANGYLFKSGRGSMDIAFQYLKQTNAKALDAIGAGQVDLYVTKTSGEQRAALMESLLKQAPQRTKGILSSSYILENNIKLRLEWALRNKIAKKIIDAPEIMEGQQFQDAKKLQDSVENTIVNAERKTYGVPSAVDFEDILTTLNLRDMAKNQKKIAEDLSYDSLLKELPEFASQIRELQQNTDNLKQFLLEIGKAISAK